MPHKWPPSAWCPVAAGCQGHDGLPRWDILSEPTDKVLSGVDRRTTEGSGRERGYAASRLHCPAGWQGQVLPLLPGSGCDPRTSQERPEVFTARTGGRAHGPGAPGR